MEHTGPHGDALLVVRVFSCTEDSGSPLKVLSAEISNRPSLSHVLYISECSFGDRALPPRAVQVSTFVTSQIPYLLPPV
jgi:hypothetical protein